MLQIRNKDKTIRLIDRPLTLEKLCISICVEKLVYSDDLPSDIARLKVINDDLFQKIISNQQFIWRRGIIDAILTGHMQRIAPGISHGFVSGETDRIICGRQDGLAIEESVSDLRSVLSGQTTYPIPGAVYMHGYQAKGFVNDGRCIIYQDPDYNANPRIFYSKLSEHFAKLHPVPIEYFSTSSVLVLNNNFLIVVGVDSLSAWHFNDEQPSLIGEASNVSIRRNNLFFSLIRKRDLNMDAIRSILSHHWYELYEQINPRSLFTCSKSISASPCFQFLVICVYSNNIYSGICVCDWLGSVIHRIDFPDVSALDITWLAERRFILSKGGLRREVLVDFTNELSVSTIHLPIYAYPNRIRMLIIPDYSGNHLLIIDDHLYRSDHVYLHDLRSGLTRCLLPITNYVDVLFDSWFILLTAVGVLQNNLSEQADALFKRSSELGIEVLSMNPRNYCLILINPDLNRVHVRECYIGTDSHTGHINVSISPPYLLINNLVFDAKKCCEAVLDKN